MISREKHWDAQIIKRLKQGDKNAFEAIYYTFEGKLFAFAFKLTHSQDDAKEIVQEVFLKVWEKREILDPDSNFEGFIYTIAKNVVYNKARHRVYELAYKEYLSRTGSAAASFTEEMLEFQELNDLIKTLCDELPPLRRKVFLLSRMEGASHEEIAQNLNTSTSNIKNHIHKALTFFKKHLKR